MLENFNAFSQIAHLDFNIPLPHILLPLALSFVTFQQIAFLFDCYKSTKGAINENLRIDFIDYALFISFFPQLIAGPIVHHREMMPQFARLGDSSCGNLSLDKHSADLVNRHKARTQSPLSLCRFTKNHESHTENPSVVLNANLNAHESSLRGESQDSPTQSTNANSNISSEKSGLRSCEQGNKTDSLLTKRTTNLPDLSPKDEFANYEYLAKGIFIFSIGLFKKVFIADSFAKWANAGFGIVENGGHLNIAESWATSLSYTFQLYFDFSGYCDMAIGLALMFGIILPLNFNSPYKSLNITEFWRRWHITLGRFLKECVYIPLGGNRGKPIFRKKSERILDEKSGLCSCERGNRTDSSLTKRTTNLPDLSPKANATTLRNLFIVAFLSGIWHGAGWGFVIWGILHGVAMVVHRIYSWFVKSLANLSCSDKSHCHTEALAEVSQIRDISPAAQYDNNAVCHANTYTTRFLNFTQTKFYKVLCWLLTFNFVNIAWIFFRAENLSGAVNLLKGMFGIVWVELPQQAYKANQILQSIGGTDRTFAYIIIAIFVCVFAKNSFEMLKNFDSKILKISISARLYGKKIWISGGAVFTRFALTLALFYASMWIMVQNLLASNAYTPFLYFNF